MNNLLLGTLTGIILILFGAYGTLNDWGIVSTILGLAGFFAICSGIKQFAETFRHVNTFPIERRVRRTAWPKYKERRQYSI